MKYHINPETGEPGVCNPVRTGQCAYGSVEHYGSPAEARRGYETSQSSFGEAPLKKRPGRESEGVVILREIMAARGKSSEAYAAWRADWENEELKASYDAAKAIVRNLNEKLASLPWTDDDGRPYRDEPLDFMETRWSKARKRKGFENDLSKLTEREHEVYRHLDAACEAWISRLSTAEVKALSTYVTDAQSYAESMAESSGAAAGYTNSFKYLHSALEKAPRSRKPFVVYAGVSAQRVKDIREQAAQGSIELNRVQSTSLNPAMVNSFMRPSDYELEDHTALEIRTSRVASLSLFHLREEMEVLLPPQTYRVAAVESGVSYAYADGYSYEPADRVYKLTEA